MFVAPGVHVEEEHVPRHVCVMTRMPVPVPHDGEHADQPDHEPQYPATAARCDDQTQMGWIHVNSQLLQDCVMDLVAPNVHV